MISTIVSYMNCFKLFFLSCLIFIFAETSLYGQVEESPNRVNEFWTGVTLKYKINKKVAFNLDHQVRITDNLNEIRSTFFEFGAKYKFNKYFASSLNYRYTIRNQERHVNRFTLDGTAKWKHKPTRIELAYRFRLQHGVVTFTKEPATYVRNRFQISYDVTKHLGLFARYESFYRFNDKNRFRQNLFASGIEFEINKKTDLALFYRMDQEINKKEPEVRNIIAVMMSFKLD